MLSSGDLGRQTAAVLKLLTSGKNAARTARNALRRERSSLPMRVIRPKSEAAERVMR